ncbi:FtsB family cell division protein [Acetivibrio clariflavus]|uniref:Septum formation initiator n=1 Tax=Acetivibrio clariflavus (strain DSM 19732 / NBRC 101661 / EBR45) TaxID=720554 RepID=G8M1Z2_ACECE|nr:septum formation initiator family protein [Acetivibrio clariflavus]AEV67075.1 septum formation initiator [Acetivibrio clariflavus DSM 19732]
MNKRKKSKLGTLLFLGALAYLTYLLINQQGILYAKKAQLDELNAKIRAEEENRERLIRQTEEVNSEENIEKIAREKLGMVKRGERVFIDVNN